VCSKITRGLLLVPETFLVFAGVTEARLYYFGIMARRLHRLERSYALSTITSGDGELDSPDVAANITSELDEDVFRPTSSTTEDTGTAVPANDEFMPPPTTEGTQRLNLEDDEVASQAVETAVEYSTTDQLPSVADASQVYTTPRMAGLKQL